MDKQNKHKFSRREFLNTSSVVLGGVALGGMLTSINRPVIPRASARSIIFVWLQGGPSHIDTFDPKPKAGKDYYGPYRKPLATNVDDVWLGTKMENLAKIADKYSLIRGMSHGHFGHETASYVALTGTSPNGQLVYPAMSSVIAFKKENEYKGSLPANISLTTPIVRFSEPGFLGPAYNSFATGGNPANSNFKVEGLENKYINQARLNNRRKLLAAIESSEKYQTETQLGKSLEAYREKSYSLLLGEAKKAFDLSTESEKTKEQYGKNNFGQSCLMARKLVEHGVQVVTVRDMGWDSHKQHFEKMETKLPVLDKGVAALINDLDQRGLLDETMVVCGGEFGRTPKILWEAPWFGGRGHYGLAYTYLVAGGGFKGGEVVGKTDNRGENVIERPVNPWDFSASLYHLIGIDPYSQLPHPQDGLAYILPDLKRDKNNNGLLTEIFKHV